MANAHSRRMQFQCKIDESAINSLFNKSAVYQILESFLLLLYSSIHSSLMFNFTIICVAKMPLKCAQTYHQSQRCGEAFKNEHFFCVLFNQNVEFSPITSIFVTQGDFNQFLTYLFLFVVPFFIIYNMCKKKNGKRIFSLFIIILLRSDNLIRRLWTS